MATRGQEREGHEQCGVRLQVQEAQRQARGHVLSLPGEPRREDGTRRDKWGHLTEVQGVHHPPRRERPRGVEPALEAGLSRRPYQRPRKSDEVDRGPYPVRDPVGKRRQGRRQPCDRRGAEERLRDLTGNELLLGVRDDALVIDEGLSLLHADNGRRQIGVKVDADRLVAIQDIEDQGDQYDEESQRRPQASRDTSAP